MHMYILTQMVKLYRDPGEQTIAKVTLGDQPPTVAVSLVEDVSVNTCKGIYSWYNCYICLLYTSPSPRDATLSRMPSSA